MAVTVLTPNNMGSTLQGAGEPNKFNVKVDGTTISVQADGSLAVIGSGVNTSPPIVGISLSGNTLVLQKADNSTDQIDLTQFAVDMNVTSIVDNGNNTYTFHQDDGGPDVVLDLNSLAGINSVATAETGSVSLAGNGTLSSPLAATVKLSSVAGNTLTEQADGLHAQLETTEELTEWGTGTILGYIRSV